MEQKSSAGKRVMVGVIVAGVVVAGLLVGAVVRYANHGRQDQLQTDDMGRQRDVMNAAKPKTTQPAAGPAMGAMVAPASTEPAGH